MNRIIPAMLMMLALLCTLMAHANESHQVWHTLLQKNVVAINDGHSTQVDYRKMAQQRSQLQSYLQHLTKVSLTEFDSWNKNEQLAFLINAYNAWTVELILTRYPELDSIKELGSFFSSPWSKKFIFLLGEQRSLDNIEHDLIRGSGRYQDPRIHFAVNCASVGCPALRAEAYVADKLDKQLEDQTIRFLSDKTRNYVNSKGLYVSSIFDWYEKDFNSPWRGADSLSTFLLLYSDALEMTKLQINTLIDDNLPIDFVKYNWHLNAKR